jgi:hypothetical protein
LLQPGLFFHRQEHYSADGFVHSKDASKKEA